MMLIIFIILLSTITLGCVDPKHRVDVTLYTVDIEFKDGSHQQVANVMSYELLTKGIFSHTIGMEIIKQNYYAETRRIHYVTSIDIIEERIVSLELDNGQYQSIMR